MTLVIRDVLFARMQEGICVKMSVQLKITFNGGNLESCFAFPSVSLSVISHKSFK